MAREFDTHDRSTWSKEFKERFKEAQEEVQDRIYNSPDPFRSEDIEDILLSHGLELDYIEMMI